MRMNQPIQLVINSTVIVLDGRKKIPIQLNPFTVVSHILCCLIGIPINAFMAGAIICTKDLRSKPRNVLLLGLSLSNLSSFLPVLIEFVYSTLYAKEELCVFYVAIVGLPYIIFLNHMLLALADRYAAIAHPFWHYKRVTVRRVLFWQVTTTLLISMVYKFAYIAQLIPLKCEIQFLQVRIISITMLVMFSACILAQIIVYLQTKHVLKNYSTPDLKHMAPSLSKKAMEEVGAKSENQVNTANIIQPPSNDQNTVLSTFTTVELNVHMSDRTLSHLEIEATQTLLCGMISLFVMTGPFILYTLIVITCHDWYDKSYCNFIVWLSPCLKELILFHAVYHPIVHLFRRSEIISALRNSKNSLGYDKN